MEGGAVGGVGAAGGGFSAGVSSPTGGFAGAGLSVSSANSAVSKETTRPGKEAQNIAGSLAASQTLQGGVQGLTKVDSTESLKVNGVGEANKTSMGDCSLGHVGKEGQSSNGVEGKGGRQNLTITQSLLKYNINSSFNLAVNASFKEKYGDIFKKLMKMSLSEELLIEILRMLQQKRTDELVKLMMVLLAGGGSQGSFTDLKG